MTTGQDSPAASKALLPRRTVVAGAIAGAAATAGFVAFRSLTGEAETASGPGSVLGAASDIPVGGGTVFADHEVVVTQPAPGVFQGFSAICTHEGCVLIEVVDATINCPCHGSQFDITDGSVVLGPAEQPLPRRAVTVDGSAVTLA